MQTFRKLFRQKTSCAQFGDLYRKECNVCRCTLRVFEHIENRGIALEQLAVDLEVDCAALQGLKDADCCDPALVLALCRHFDMEAPTACPKEKVR